VSLNTENRTVWTLSLRMFSSLVGYGTGLAWSPRFSFHADDQAQAESLAKSWARYQGFSPSEVAVSPATEEQSQDGWLSDEFVDRWREGC
jgi:hypothetical protein